MQPDTVPQCSIVADVEFYPAETRRAPALSLYTVKAVCGLSGFSRSVAWTVMTFNLSTAQWEPSFQGLFNYPEML